MISSAQLTSVQRLAPVFSNLHRLRFGNSPNPFTAGSRVFSKRQQLVNNRRCSFGAAMSRPMASAATASQPQGAAVDARDLSGLAKTIWGQQDLKPRYSQLAEDTEADICVVGGGITGLSIAYSLQKSGKSVVLIESRAIGAGQTGKATGVAHRWWLDSFQEAESKMGIEKATVLASSLKRAVDWLEKTAKDNDIKCDWQRVPTYMFPADQQQDSLAFLDKERQAAQRVGLDDVDWTDLKGDGKAGNIGRCLEIPGSAQFHPLKFVHGLAEAFVSAGGRIFEQTHMESQSLGGHKVHTRHGPTIHAGKVVMATFMPLVANLAVVSRQVPERYYVVALELPEGVQDGNFATTERPRHEVRQAEVDGKRVLLVAGENHHQGQDYGKNRWADLEQWARQRWPAAGQVTHRWSGTMLQPAENIHLIGVDPLDPTRSTYVATGDSGQSATMAATAADVLTDVLNDRSSPYADLFNPERLPGIKDVPGLAEYGKGLVQAYAQYVLPSFESAEDLQPGDGAVMQKGPLKAAVYRDDNGDLHKMAATCTHLGCVVAWNPHEKTWDCPCHGSFYDCKGRIVQGPAATDLKSLDW
jgi:glycine/D-amino acid oxidase-like deaminating enzyme/nitrite reductase/ring-hydroxylating ferredoxin subunit